MVIHKTLVELMGYSQVIGDLTIVPTRIDADDYECEVEFYVYNTDKKRRKYVRRGKHKDFVFSTSVDGLPFTINVETNVIKNVRNF